MITPPPPLTTAEKYLCFAELCQRQISKPWSATDDAHFLKGIRTALNALALPGDAASDALWAAFDQAPVYSLNYEHKLIACLAIWFTAKAASTQDDPS